jgi:hypothetical protein
MTTYVQSATLYLCEYDINIMAFCERPIMPLAAVEKFNSGTNVRVLRYDGTRIEWYTDGTIMKYGIDGNHMRYDRKPTLNDAVTKPYCRDCSNLSYNFHKDGSVTVVQGAGVWHWGTEWDGTPEFGQIYYDRPCGEGRCWPETCVALCMDDSE